MKRHRSRACCGEHCAGQGSQLLRNTKRRTMCAPRRPTPQEKPLATADLVRESALITPYGNRRCAGLVFPDIHLFGLLRERYGLDSLRSCSACLLAFFASDLALALGASCSMALPRLIAPEPAVFDLRASNPPGMSRFLATWAAATHWPRFLKPLHAEVASSPVSVLILPAIAVLWARTSFGEECIMSMWLADGEFPSPPVVAEPREPEGPAPAGGPPPGRLRCASAGVVPAMIMMAKTESRSCFTETSFKLVMRGDKTD